MHILRDAPGRTCWITVTETDSTRFLQLAGCEEGAMERNSEFPVFQYLWFHQCSLLAARPRRLLVLGAGAFTAPKCLALAHPDAEVDAVDIEPELEPIARQYFRLGEPAFARIRFHGVPVDEYLGQGTVPYDFVFDDLFDGFQHVPDASRTRDHFQQVRRVLGDDAVFVKNVIWSPHSAETQAAYAEAQAALRDVFSQSLILALGTAERGHNRLLVGATERTTLTLADVMARLAGNVPPMLLENVRCIV